VGRCRRRRPERAAASALVDEASAFLHGRLGAGLIGSAGSVPIWLHIDGVAHRGPVEILHEATNTSTDPGPIGSWSSATVGILAELVQLSVGIPMASSSCSGRDRCRSSFGSWGPDSPICTRMTSSSWP
jgi:hypothetical protein